MRCLPPAILLVWEHEITGDLPDDVAQRPDPGREALEALAIEAYRSGALTHHQASQLLRVPRLEFEALLKRRHVEEHVILTLRISSRISRPSSGSRPAGGCRRRDC